MVPRFKNFLLLSSWLAAAAVMPQAMAQSVTTLGETPLADLAPGDIAQAQRLREAALAGNLAFELVDSLVTEIGSRPAGSENDRRAVDWALAKLRALGFPEVRAEPVPLRFWKRGEAHAHLTAPFPHALEMAALGNSAATPREGVRAEVAYYADLDALRADTGDRARGRIVFIDQKMERVRDGRGYGRAVMARISGPAEAARRGALAAVVRSIGTDRNRLAHTGATTFPKDVTPIPALAVSIPDADLIARTVRYGQPVRMHIALGAESDLAGASHNVIAEIPGSDLAREVVLIGAHLDTWDTTPGAVDDGAGVGIVTAAAKLILDLGVRPRRTIRVILFASEENGFHGADAYSRAYRDQVHQFVGESDFGAGAIYRFQSRVRREALPAAAAIARELAPLGIAPGGNEGNPGPDAARLMRRHGWSALELSQDGSDYFDWHHTPNDTLDKVDPAKLRQNVAAWAVTTWLAAQSETAFGPIER